MKKWLKNYWAALVPLAVLLIALLFLFKKSGSEKERLIGMVDAHFVDVAALLPGKMDSLLVKQGDTVQKGQLLGLLRTTEINTVRDQASAAIKAAQAQLDLLQNGSRPETVQAAQKLTEIAREQYDLMQKTYQRVQNLYEKDVVSGEERDIVYFKYQAAKKEMETARLNLQMLQKGSRPELIRASQAILEQAQKGYELSSSIAENAEIRAPIDGVISTLIINQGEVVAMGYPIMTIRENDSFFIRFSLRQDHIGKLEKGKSLKIRAPGVSPEIFQATVSSIAPNLEFANWVPSADKGKFELRTFTVECKPMPKQSIQGLRAGMTAEWIEE